MKRKYLSLILAVAMTMSACLSGCGNASGEVSSEASSNAETSKTSESKAEESKVESSESKAELEEKTIQFWLYGPGKQKDSEMVWEAFNEMLQEYVPNTTVEFTVLTGGEFKEKYNQMLASEEAIDMTWVANWSIGEFPEQIRDGNFMALDDIVNEYGQGIKESLGDTILDMHRFEDGQLYYLINWQGLFGSRHGFQVPTELAELAGDTWLEDTQEVVTKWRNAEVYDLNEFQAVFDQFDIYLGACADAGKLYSGITNKVFCGTVNLGRPASRALDSATSIGVMKGDNEFKVVDYIQSDYFRLYAENIADYYNKGYIRSDIASVDVSQLTTVAGGEYTPNTVILHTLSDLVDTAEQATAAAGTDISVIRLENEGYLNKGDSTAMAIPYCADEPERAMMVLNALYTVPELYHLLVYGIEGVHYTDNGDGTVTSPYQNRVSAEADYGLANWTLATCENSLVTQTDTPGYYDKLKEEEKTALVNELNNFSFDITPVQDVVTAIKAIDAEYSDIINKGYAGDDWEATLDKWIAERKAAGVDSLIEEFQKQLNAFLEKNNFTSWDQIIHH